MPPVVDQVLSTPGRPLDGHVRTFMESRFGHDFSRMRIHTDRRAAESARAVGALAYTVGRDVVFGEGHYAPDTTAGRRLLAHELSHVVQQQSHQSSGQADLGVDAPGAAAEQEAKRTAWRALDPHGTPEAPALARLSGPLLQRQEAPPGRAPVSPEIANLPWGQYVDRFEHVYYDLDYRSEGGNLSKWLTAVYADGTVIDIYIDDIVGETVTAEAMRDLMAQGYVGDGGRVFPRRMNPQTTPRLWAARESAIEAMEEFNLQFMMMTVPVVLFIITMPLAVKTGPVKATRTPVPRAPLVKAGADRWAQTLEYAMKPNTLRHIFGKAQHNLAPVVKQLGSEEAVIRQTVTGLRGASLPAAGQYQVVVNVAGTNITVRGAVVNGVVRISTMFVP